MKINLARSAGFCFGVKRALKIALNIAGSCKNVYMLGDIVHNEDVVSWIKTSGIKKITGLSCGKNKILLIRAHGSGLAVYKRARELGYQIIDATCPMVKEIHRIVQEMEKENYRIIVIGDKLHDEVQGIVGQLKNKAIVIDKIRNIPIKTLKKIKKACIVVQSTQNLDKALEMEKIIRSIIPDLKFYNTICMPTRLKQQEIKTMPLKNDVIIVIGSKDSANTKRLYEISRKLNKRTYWVNAKEELKKRWFKKAKGAGVTAGASTPDSATAAIIRRIKQLCRDPLKS